MNSFLDNPLKPGGTHCPNREKDAQVQPITSHQTRHEWGWTRLGILCVFPQTLDPLIAHVLSVDCKVVRPAPVSLIQGHDIAFELWRWGCGSRV
jgi:hypothetical protein